MPRALRGYLSPDSLYCRGLGRPLWADNTARQVAQILSVAWLAARDQLAEPYWRTVARYSATRAFASACRRLHCGRASRCHLDQVDYSRGLAGDRSQDRAERRLVQGSLAHASASVAHASAAAHRRPHPSAYCGGADPSYLPRDPLPNSLLAQSSAASSAVLAGHRHTRHIDQTDFQADFRAYAQVEHSVGDDALARTSVVVLAALFYPRTCRESYALCALLNPGLVGH